MQENVINIMPYIQEKRKRLERAQEQLQADINVFDIIEDLTKYVDAYKLILEN